MLSFLSDETRFNLRQLLKTFLDQKLHHSILHNINSSLGWIKITKSCLKVCFFTFIFLYIFYQSLFSRTCYEQLREDFQFNLAVLDERDRELARYDSLTAKALTVNRNRYSYHILYGPICVCWDAFFFFFLHFSYIVLFILHYPIWKKYNGYLFKKKKHRSAAVPFSGIFQVSDIYIHLSSSGIYTMIVTHWCSFIYVTETKLVCSCHDF